MARLITLTLACSESTGKIKDSISLKNRPWKNFRACYIDGWLDDVRIYNRALSETEVQALESMGD